MTRPVTIALAQQSAQLVLAGDHENIRKIDAAGFYGNAHLIFAWLRISNVFQHQFIRRAVRLAKNRLQ